MHPLTLPRRPSFGLCTLVLSLGVLLGGCASLKNMLGGGFQKPTLKFQKMHLKNVSFEAMTLDFEFELHNPNPMALTFAHLEHQLDFDGHTLFKGRTDKGNQIKANGKSTLTVPLTVEFKEFAESLVGFLKAKDEVPYRLQAGFGIETPVGIINLPMDVDGKVPVPKLPKISVAKVEMGSLGFTGTEIRFRLKVGNQGKFPLRIRGFEYDVALVDVPVSQGQAELADVPAGESRELTVPVKLNFLKLGLAVVKAVKSRDIPYRFGGALNLGPLKLPFKLEGQASL